MPDHLTGVVVVFPSLGALVCDAGGAMSHAAVIAREFCIPAVVATAGGTTTIADGTPGPRGRDSRAM